MNRRGKNKRIISKNLEKSFKKRIEMGSNPVLLEVRRKLATGKPAKVIIGIHKKRDLGEVRKYLEKLNIQVKKRSTDHYLFATITEKQADLIDKQNARDNEKRLIEYVWLDKDIYPMVLPSYVRSNCFVHNLLNRGI